MSRVETPAEFNIDTSNHEIVCKGSWTIRFLESAVSNLNVEAFKGVKAPININGKEITELDSAGALALFKLKKEFLNTDNLITFVGFNQEQLELIALLENKKEIICFEPETPSSHPILDRLGREAVNKVLQIDGLLGLIGQLSEIIVSTAGHLKRLQIPSIVSNIKTTGIQALPIIALLSFLIGVVLAYQMGLQLETYGASNFIAYLSGMAIFREFAPLITAIIIAGRTSSAFTAQIGSMKINEEVDALETMGLSPVELLVLPKLLALLLVFPLLIFWADIFSIWGAMLLSKFKLGVSYFDFLSRIRESVGAKQMLLGLYKAPVFAILVALVGCFQGFRVEANTTSIGHQTTKSVVQALFLIIIVDAVFSVIYSWLRV